MLPQYRESYDKKSSTLFFLSHSVEYVKMYLQSPSQAIPPIERPSARHQFTPPDHRYGASASRGVPVYVPAFTGTHCT